MQLPDRRYWNIHHIMLPLWSKLCNSPQHLSVWCRCPSEGLKTAWSASQDPPSSPLTCPLAHSVPAASATSILLKLARHTPALRPLFSLSSFLEQSFLRYQKNWNYKDLESLCTEEIWSQSVQGCYCVTPWCAIRLLAQKFMLRHHSLRILHGTR